MTQFDVHRSINTNLGSPRGWVKRMETKSFSSWRVWTNVWTTISWSLSAALMAELQKTPLKGQGNICVGIREKHLTITECRWLSDIQELHSQVFNANQKNIGRNIRPIICPVLSSHLKLQNLQTQPQRSAQVGCLSFVVRAYLLQNH